MQLLSGDLGEIRAWVAEHIHRRASLLIARRRLADGKLEGIPPEWVEALFLVEGVSVIVDEADGAAGRPLKAPRAGEPVLPGNTTLIVPVAGIDGLDRPLDEAWVFRSAIASRLLGLPPGSSVTDGAAARLIQALLEGRPPGSRVVPVINKIDLPGGREKAERLARRLLSTDPGIRRVLLGRLRETPDVEAIAAEGWPRRP